MFKYEKKWCYRVLVMFLALAIFLSGPFSSLHAFATKDYHTIETFDDEGMLPDTNTDEDNGSDLEEELPTEEDIHDDQLTEASVEEDMPPDREDELDEEESTGMENQDQIPDKSNEDKDSSKSELDFTQDDLSIENDMLETDNSIINLMDTGPLDIEGEMVCEMDGTEYPTLHDALEKAGFTATIKLLTSTTTDQSLIIDNKSITLNLDNYSLTIDTSADEGLKVTNGTLELLGEGQLNAKGKLFGVWADNSTVTVTNAMATDKDNSGIGVYANHGSDVTVHDFAHGTGHGVKAEGSTTKVMVYGNVSNNAPSKAAVHSSSADVTVKGNVSSLLGYGVYTYYGKITVDNNVIGSELGAYTEGNTAEIYIKGDLSSGKRGALIDSGNGTITVDGEINSSGESFVKIGSKEFAKNEGILDPDKLGYLKYSNGGTVWVKDHSAILLVSDPDELETALANVDDGGIIRLTNDIDYTKNIVVDGKSITLDVGTFTLNLNVNWPGVKVFGLEVKNEGGLALTGSGEFNINVNGGNASAGVYVNQACSATVTNVKVNVTSGSAFGVYANRNGSRIHVLGDVEVTGPEGGCGAKTWGTGQIRIEGIMTASIYINLNDVYKPKDSGVEDNGYLKYSAEKNGPGIVWVKISPAVCDISGKGRYDSLAEALSAATDGDTIILLKDLSYENDLLDEAAIEINGKTITLDLNGNSLTISNPSGAGLELVNGANLDIIGTGNLIIDAKGNALSVESSRFTQGTDTTISLKSSNGAGVFAKGAPWIYLLGNIIDGVTGVHTEDGSSVTVLGNITANKGVYAKENSVVTVFGDINAVIGAHIKENDVFINEDHTKVDIFGKIILKEGAEEDDYIIVGRKNYPESWGALKRSSEWIQEEFLIYPDEFGEAIVSVKTDSLIPERICARLNYGGNDYDLLYSELDAALYPDRESAEYEIELLENINYTKTINTNTCRWRLILNGYALNVNTSGAYGLHATSDFTIKGPGEFNVEGTEYGVYAVGVDTYVEVTNATAVGDTGIGIYTDLGADVRALGDVSGVKCGILIDDNRSEVIVEGNIKDSDVGVIFQLDLGDPLATVTVEGSIYTDINRFMQLGDLFVESEGTLDHGNDEKKDYLLYADGHYPNVKLWVRNAEFYNLTVVNGLGSGRFAEGVWVPIMANIPVGKMFDMWISDGGGEFEEFEEDNRPRAWFKMPSNDVTVTAVLSGDPIETYLLTVENGSGGGNYAPGSQVTIKANPPAEGKEFDKWISEGGGEFEDPNEMLTVFTMPSNDVIVTATYKELVPTYLLTVENGSGGGSYAPGTEVTIKANPPAEGKVFDKWISNGGGEFKDANRPNTIFTMPANPVTITATYKDVPIETYTLTVKGSYAENSGAGTYAPGTKVIIHAGNRSNYSFAGWTTSGDVKFANSSSPTTTFTMPNANLTVTANWTYKGGGGNVGGGGYSYEAPTVESPKTKTTILEEKKPDQPVTVAALVVVTAEDKGEAKTVISHKIITDAINHAQSYAKGQGKTRNGISVELDLNIPKDSSSLTVTHTQSALDNLVKTGVKSYKISGYPVSISFDEKALEEIKNQSEGDVTISIKPIENIATAAKDLIGIRPVYRIGVSYVKDGKTIMISDLNHGIATISIQYEAGKDEMVSYLSGAYVNERGNATLIDGANYDIHERVLKITTNHLLIHGVGYKKPSAKFIDIENHWGKESIEYVVARGLLTGTSETTFAPDMAMTRAMLVTALGRLSGVDVNAYDTNSFADVKANSPFRPYIEWAYKKGIVKGIGNQKFAPDRPITRDEIAVIFANYARATGYKLPIIREATSYVDATSIGSLYKTAVTAMQQAGIMIGDTNNQFNPKNNATRAELSCMLHRYINLTIDPKTAHGWTFNDAGQWFYYKDGEKLTGTQTIDGMKYFFNKNGSLRTGWVKEGHNWRYYSGNNATVGWMEVDDKTYYFTDDGLMVSDKWMEIDDNWYYFYYDGSLAKDTMVDGYEIDKEGVRIDKTKKVKQGQSIRGI